MAGHHVVLLNFPGEVPTEKLNKFFNNLKDWLRFSPESWLVYTALSASELRDRLHEEFKTEDPSILILPTTLDGWAAFAKVLPREWIKTTREASASGE